MNFLSPLALLFAVTIPVVVVFYLLKRKRVVKLVSSTLLWRRFLTDTQANAPFQKLRHNWLLILQILILLLAVLALARPYFAGQQKPTTLRVLVLDGSASMQATDEKPSRFEKARAEALKWVDGMRDDEQAMVLVAGANAEVKQSPTTEKGALRRAIEAARPCDCPTRLTEALNTAAAFTYEKRGEEERTTGEIHLFSDGAIPNLSEFANKNLPLVYHRIGRGGNNVGIVSLEAKANPENAAQRALFLNVINPGNSAVETEVELKFDDAVVELRPVTLPPTNTLPLIFFATQPQDGVFTARLTIKDDLAADNQASVVSLLPKNVKVLLVTRGNRWLEKVLRSGPNVQLTVAATLADDAPGFDIVVLDDVTPPVWPSGNVLAVHVTSTNLFPEFRTVDAPAIVDWRNSHPLLRFVNFDNVQIGEALAVKAPTWGEPIVDSPQTPLIVAGELNRRRAVWVSFDTLQSTWPLRVSFPIFVVNALDWLNPASSGASQFVVRGGDPLRLTLAESVKSASVIDPGGKVHALVLDANAREIVFGDTGRQGIYRLRADTNDIPFCVNLMDAFESNIMPQEELPLGGKFGQTLKAAAGAKANKEIWRWLALAGLLILLFEWWYYHRRTA